MKDIIVSELSTLIKLSREDIERALEVPPSQELGDFAFPCFSLAKVLKKNPVEIAKDISSKIKNPAFEKVESHGPYINFFLNNQKVTFDILKDILKQGDKYGSSKQGAGKKVVLDMSSPNIAKPFGIGHLRSTIIGNSISKIYSFLGYKTTKINYLGDWGTQFGKLIVGYKKFGDAKKLKKEPIKHLLELYVKGNSEEYDQEARDWFKKLEDGDKEALRLWKLFKNMSIKEFSNIYDLMNIKFDVISGESLYNKKMDETVKELREKGLLVKSEGAEGVDLEKYNLGFCLIRKSDGATLYATRDLTAAIDRFNKYHFNRMIYEVGQEQKLHFQQLFKVLELMGYSWAKNCTHVSHGLYLDKDGKKFSTREGKTVFMEDILTETISLAREEISKREKLSKNELEKRAKIIAIAAIFYGDLKNNRVNDMTFDIGKFISFEGNTGPYLLYTYARAKSILRKAKYKPKSGISGVGDKEKSLALLLSRFPEIINHSCKELSPAIIANYAFEISQKFNEFYHSEQVIGSENEQLRLTLVDCFSQVLKNSLSLLGIEALEKM